MITPEQKHIIDVIIWRLDAEVIKTMKRLSPNELYGWKEKEDDKD